jgi:hypothetical protein
VERGDDERDGSLYFTTEKGKISKNAVPMNSDKTKRMELIYHHSVPNPAPGTYATLAQLNMGMPSPKLKISDPRDNSL